MNAEEGRFESWLAKYNEVASNNLHSSAVANWNYEVDLTELNARQLEKYSADINSFQIDAADTVQNFDKSKIHNQTYIRLIKRLEKVGTRLSYEDGKAVSKLISDMSGIFSKATVCYPNCNNLLSQGNLEYIMAYTRDFDALRYVWKSWRDVSGKKLKSSYERFVQLSNKGAKADGFSDTGDFWRYSYEEPNFNNTIAKLWEELLPMYEEIHTYVRRKLRRFYQNRFKTSTIPAHILGDMWSQSWVHIYDITAPFPQEPTVDVTREMRNQQYTVGKMFHLADDFFGSLGLQKVSDSFWRRSMFEKPIDRDVVCHASAYDLYDGKDFRIKMCSSVSCSLLFLYTH